MKRGILLSIIFVLGSEMKHLNNNKKRNNTVLRALSLAVLATTIAVLTGPVTIIIIGTNQSAEATTLDPIPLRSARAPSVVSGDNIYIAWWTNNTENGNEEVMFRASTDGGETFGDRINLSNTTDADSWRVELHGEGDTVVVSWWETNQTSDIPVARISTDAGETFGPMLTLATNGTISGTEEEEGGGGGETVEEAAAGGGGGG
jgi:hypothetical protein